MYRKKPSYKVNNSTVNNDGVNNSGTPVHHLSGSSNLSNNPDASYARSTHQDGPTPSGQSYSNRGGYSNNRGSSSDRYGAPRYQQGERTAPDRSSGEKSFNDRIHHERRPSFGKPEREPADNKLSVGQALGPHLVVGEAIGSGSTARVYRCSDSRLPGVPLALKVAYPEVARDRVATFRFRREFETLRLINHPRIIRGLEFHEIDRMVAFTMQLGEKGDAAHLLSAHKRLPIATVLMMLSDVLESLRFLHEKGMIHRNPKLDNIIIDENDRFLLGDFGIATHLKSNDGAPEDGGTLEIVSPEYHLDGEISTLGDLYGLGISAYRCLTGQTPFTGKTVVERTTRFLYSDPRPLSHVNTELPTWIDPLIGKAILRRKALRYQSADEWLNEVKRAAQENEIVLPSMA